jgi:NodT family efflux transporter outer membrane factor (OMF) lipoprotein
MKRLLLLACVLPLAASCAVGPDFKPPPAPEATGYTVHPLTDTVSTPVANGEAQHFRNGADIAGDWWHLFGSPALDDLVRQALAANPSLPAAQASLRQAMEAVAAQRGSYFPTVDAELSASRTLTPTGAISPASASGNPYFGLITPQLNVSFVPDVWGANFRAVESAEAAADAQRGALEAAWVTLTSNVVAGAIQEASLRAQIAATEDTIRVEEDLLGILRRQQGLGQAAGADVAQQEAALAQAQLVLPPLRKQLDVQRDALTALAGRLPDKEIAQTFDLTGLKLPVDVPVSLPSVLISQRPDVQQAEANLHVASANIGQAVAARLPQITLSAQLGNSANSVSQMFTPGTNFWTLGAGVTQPLFEGFTLLHKERAARAAFDQAAAQYRSTVITAMQNVADSLKALGHDADAVRSAAQADQAASRSLGIARQQLALGQVSYQALLTAQNASAQARLALVQAQATRLADTAALFQALGGGWWHDSSLTVAAEGNTKGS